MGAGKAFGSVCEKYELGEYNEFNTLLKDNNAIVSGSEILKLYFAYNKIVLNNDFEANDLDIFVQRKVIKTETVDGFNKEITNIDMINKFLVSKGYEGDILKHAPKNYLDFVSEDLIKVFEYKKESSFKDNVPLSKKIQIIVVKNDAMKYISSFDLSCCMYYWNPEKEIVEYCGKEEYKGTIKSELYLEFSNYNAVHRAKKYIDRGFEFYYKNRNINELLKFMDRKCHKVQIYDLKDFLEPKPSVVKKPGFVSRPEAVIPIAAPVPTGTESSAYPLASTASTESVEDTAEPSVKDVIDALMNCTFDDKDFEETIASDESDGGDNEESDDEDFNPRRIRDRINAVVGRKEVQSPKPRVARSNSLNL